jgi:hypothetical protein
MGIGIVLIVFGCIAIAVGIRGGEFYAGGADGIGSFNQRSSKRSGRVVFILAGVGLLAVGVKILVFGQ